MKVIINGANGYMGRLTVEEFEKAGHQVVAKIDPTGEGFLRSFDEVKWSADLLVDFSFHTTAKAVCDYALKNDIPAVIATTGHTEEEKSYIYNAAKSVPVFYSGNMSLGIALLIDFAKKAAIAFPEADIEIIEKHHNRKVDAPSGTALMLAESVKSVRADAEIICGRYGSHKREKGEIGIASLRLANVVGEHEVIIATPTQTLSLTHQAHDRRLFAEGTVKAAEYLLGKSAGIYDITTMAK